MRARLKAPSAVFHGMRHAHLRAMAGRIGWTLYASDLLARAQTVAPLDELHLDGLALFAACDVAPFAWTEPDGLIAFVAAPLILPADDPEWTNPRAVTDAANFLANRALLTPEQFAALADQYREAAFSIAGVTETDMLATVRDALAESVRAGESREQATARVDAAFDAAGYSRLDPWHARLVAEMAHSTAYGRAQWDTLRDPRVSGALPAYRYQTMEDDRVRPTHAAMQGYTASRDDPVWLTWRPPNGYNCRCRLVGVPAAQWDGTSDAHPTLLGHEAMPDEGFDTAPGAYVSGLAEPSINRRVRDVNALARKLPAGYTPPVGWHVVAVFAAMTTTLLREWATHETLEESHV